MMMEAVQREELFNYGAPRGTASVNLRIPARRQRVFKREPKVDPKGQAVLKPQITRIAEMNESVHRIYSTSQLSPHASSPANNQC